MTVKADEQGRISCAELFPPNATFEASTEPDGTIRLVMMASKKQRSQAKELGGPRFGFLAGKISLAPDFDAPLEVFREYME